MSARGFLYAVSLAALFMATVMAQGPPGGRGRGQGAGAVAQEGAALYRMRCAECHGADGRGVAGHDLTRVFASGATDERVFQTIRNGVPNTIMPSSTAPDAELNALVGYLRSLNGPVTAAPLRGNAESGEKLFAANCASCHAINGRGGRLGPDLSRISQSPDQLTEAIRSPAASIPTGYQTVTLVMRDGQKVRGTIKGEDAFSIQIMDTGQRLRAYLKSSLQNVVRDTGSLMPDYSQSRLSDGDLDDLVRYLSAFRVAPARGRGRGGL
jgi:putative heme-binding domain-containing protein